MTVFERISDLAKQQGKSLNKLSEDLGFSKNAIYTWKTSSPKSETLEKVADYFNVSTDYLLGRTDNPTPNSDDEEYGDLIMMFRKNEQEIPEYKRDRYRKQVKDLMEYIKNSMNEDD